MTFSVTLYTAEHAVGRHARRSARPAGLTGGSARQGGSPLVPQLAPRHRRIWCVAVATAPTAWPPRRARVLEHAVGRHARRSARPAGLTGGSARQGGSPACATARAAPSAHLVRRGRHCVIWPGHSALRHAVWALGVPISMYYYEIMRVPDELGRVATHSAKRTGCERPACTGKVSAEGSRSRRPHGHSGRIVGAHTGNF